MASSMFGVEDNIDFENCYMIVYLLKILRVLKTCYTQV